MKLRRISKKAAASLIKAGWTLTESPNKSYTLLDHAGVAVYWIDSKAGQELQKPKGIRVIKITTKPNKKPHPAKKDTVPRTMHLLEEDYILLRDIAKNRNMTRYDALCLLQDILPTLQIPLRTKRRSLRLSVPTPLHEAINQKAKETNRTYIEIILIAARAWTEANPLPIQ